MKARGVAREPDPEEADPGLAKQRTDMAWTRTAIAFAAAGAAILKSHVVPGVIVLGLGAVTWGLRRIFPAVGADGIARSRRLFLVTVAVTTVAVVALAVALTAPSTVR